MMKLRKGRERQEIVIQRNVVKQNQVNNADSAFIFIINIFIPQDYQSGSVGWGGQLVRLVQVVQVLQVVQAVQAVQVVQVVIVIQVVRVA